MEKLLFLINQTNPDSIKGTISVPELRQLIKNGDIPNEIAIYMQNNFHGSGSSLTNPAQKLESFICEVPMIHTYTNGMSLSGLLVPLDYIQDQINNFLRQGKDWWLKNLFPGNDAQKGNAQDPQNPEENEEGVGGILGMVSKSSSGGSENNRKPKGDGDIIESILDMRAFADFWNAASVETRTKKFGYIPEKIINLSIRDGQSFDAIQRYTKLPLMSNSYLADLSYDRKISEQFLQEHKINSYNDIWSFITQSQDTETRINNLINFVAVWNFADEITRRELYVDVSEKSEISTKDQKQLLKIIRSDRIRNLNDAATLIELLKKINPNEVHKIISTDDLNRLFRLDLIPNAIVELVENTNDDKLNLSAFETFLCVDPNSNDESRRSQIQTNGVSSDFFYNLYDQTVGRLLRLL